MDTDRFIKRRKELKLTMTYIAKQVGVSSTTVSRWETGYINNMRRDKINKYAKALQVSPLWVMGIESKSPAESFFGDVRALVDKYSEPYVDSTNYSEQSELMSCLITIMSELPNMNPKAAKAALEYFIYLKGKGDCL